MNFFEAQERARTRTGRLALLFAAAVAGTVLSSYAAALFILRFTGARGGDIHTPHGPETPFVASAGLWDPGLFAATALLVLGIIGVASLLRWSQLRGGGASVAQRLGGRLVQPAQAQGNERRFLNVVEEMAIASGLPVPAAYVLDNEQGINAFAAGLGSNDAVVAVTRGTLDTLTRDELQGVVAHEFSHILNGDMRLNLRLSSLLFGILVLGVLGRGLVRSVGRVRVGSGGGRKGKGDPRALLLLIGVALMVIGYLGYFFGRLIQAAISRQREFLADASAVQFTRNPQGIGGALMKIGGRARSGGGGSRLEVNEAAEFRHFFFAEGTASLFGGFATHPPLDERIRAIDQTWDGRFATNSYDNDTPGADTLETPQDSRAAGFAGDEGSSPAEGLPTAPLPRPAPASEVRMPFVAAHLVERAGTLTRAHFDRARETIGRLPLALRRAAETPDEAPSLVAALMLHRQSLVPPVEAPLEAGKLGHFHAATVSLDDDLRLPLVQIALPSLLRLESQPRVRLVSQLHTLAAADGSTSPFEFALLAMVARGLSPRPAGGDAFGGIHSFHAVEHEIGLLLSMLAWVGAGDEKQAGLALATGYSQLRLLENGARLLAREACAAEPLFRALEKMGRCTLPIRKRFLEAAAHVVGSDGSISLAEAELLRAVSLAIDCPLPLWDSP